MTTETMPEPRLTDQRRNEVLRQCLSVGIATGAYGISFGALSVAAGLSIWQTIALSALLFSGASQFAVVGIIAAGGAGAAAVATSSLLGARNGIYGLQMSRLLGVRGLRRIPAAQLTIDESTAVAIGQSEPAAQRLGFWGTGLSVFLLWNLSTVLGAIVGNALGDPGQYGLDAAAPAAFCALLWPRLKHGDARAVAVIAAVIALVVAPHAPAGIPVLVAALAAIVAGVLPSRGSPGSQGLRGAPGSRWSPAPRGSRGSRWSPGSRGSAGSPGSPESETRDADGDPGAPPDEEAPA